MNKTIKRNVAGILSATMLVSSMAVVPSTTVSAETTVDYGDALALSLYFYDEQQCGTEVDDNCITWRGNCHTYDAEASLDNATGLGATEKAFIQQANGGSNTVDVSGGYHDAGDHLKFSMTMAYSSTNLAWAYYMYPEAFTETGSKDHLFDILKEMCDYFMKVTYLDDSDEVVTFCYMVGGDQDHNEWSSPETQTMNRPTYWATKSKNSTDTACQMAAALASASMALKEVDSEYASECLKYANALQKFGSTYVNACYDGVGSYYSSGSQKDDIAWGDLWCNLANGTIDSYSPIVPQDGVYNGEYDYWVYSWDKLWGGYSTLLSQLGFGSSFTNEVKFEMDKLNTNYSQAYYPIGGGWGASRYNCAWQMYAMQYAEATGNDQYYTYAKSQMDYLLGNNSSGRSYLIGYGDTYPVNIHHRAANPTKTSATYTLYGALVGGPTDANGSYDDSTDSYSCTEPALDYNGSFIMAIAGLYNKYGNGATNLSSIITNASEIDENFTFGSWYASGNSSEPITTTVTTVTQEETITTTTGIKTVDGVITAVDGNNVTIEVVEDGQTLTTTVDATSSKFIFDGSYNVGDTVKVTGYATSIANDPTWWFNSASFTVESSNITTAEVTNITEEITTTEPTTEATTTETSVETAVTTVETTTTTSESAGGTTNSDGVKGDANGDGKVLANDLLLVKKHILSIETLADQAFNNVDLNGDGKVLANDLVTLKKFLLGITKEL